MRDTCTWTVLPCILDTVEDPFHRSTSTYQKIPEVNIFPHKKPDNNMKIKVFAKKKEISLGLKIHKIFKQ